MLYILISTASNWIWGWVEEHTHTPNFSLIFNSTNVVHSFCCCCSVFLHRCRVCMRFVWHWHFALPRPNNILVAFDWNSGLIYINFSFLLFLAFLFSCRLFRETMTRTQKQQDTRRGTYSSATERADRENPFPCIIHIWKGIIKYILCCRSLLFKKKYCVIFVFFFFYSLLLLLLFLFPRPTDSRDVGPLHFVWGVR